MPKRPPNPPAALNASIIADVLRLRGPQVLAPNELNRLSAYLVDLHHRGGDLPARGRGFRWAAIAERSGVDPARLAAGRAVLAPLLRRLHAELQARGGRPRRPPRPPGQELFPFEAPRRAPPPAADPGAFRAAIKAQMAARGLSARAVCRALAANNVTASAATLTGWLSGRRVPARAESYAVVAGLERLWRMWPGDLSGCLPGLRGPAMTALPAILRGSARGLVRWHLPDDFARLAAGEQAEILDWVRTVVLRGATPYRRFVAAAQRQRYGMRLPGLAVDGSAVPPAPRAWLTGKAPEAPQGLAREMAALLDFKTAPLGAAGIRRRTLWGPETAALQVQAFSLLFGSLAAARDGPVAGFGAPPERLGFALLLAPAVWDWHLQWRQRRRGFLVVSEAALLSTMATLAHPRHGWLPQTPGLAARLRPVPGLVTAAEVRQARADWTGACARLHRFALDRAREVRRIARVHHDRFEAIEAVLAHDRPAAVYSRIADEILAYRPSAEAAPLAAAESTRGFLMIRLGLHLGFRQRNLRELLLTPRGAPFRASRELEARRRAELRWNGRDGAWEVFAPPCAFKNATSSFFDGRPYLQRLPDLGGLYEEIEAYLRTHRRRLLGGRADPGTFFVLRPLSRESPEMSGHAFQYVWRRHIQRHGIFNPFTGRGAVAGLLPHGPHNVRDVVATHILKQTGSFEQASYAIQDTPETARRHYARFLPGEKTHLAAAVLNQVWAPSGGRG